MAIAGISNRNVFAKHLTIGTKCLLVVIFMTTLGCSCGRGTLYIPSSINTMPKSNMVLVATQDNLYLPTIASVDGVDMRDRHCILKNTKDYDIYLMPGAHTFQIQTAHWEYIGSSNTVHIYKGFIHSPGVGGGPDIVYPGGAHFKATVITKPCTLQLDRPGGKYTQLEVMKLCGLICTQYDCYPYYNTPSD